MLFPFVLVRILVYLVQLNQEGGSGKLSESVILSEVSERPGNMCSLRLEPDSLRLDSVLGLSIGLKLGFGTKVSSGNNKSNEVAELEIFISPLTSTYKEMMKKSAWNSNCSQSITYKPTLPYPNQVITSFFRPV